MKLLLDNGADINVVNTKNNTALILATGEAFEKAAELLIERGADVNVVGQDNETGEITLIYYQIVCLNVFFLIFVSALTWAADKGT